MRTQRWFRFAPVLLVAALLAAACGQAQTTQAPQQAAPQPAAPSTSGQPASSQPAPAAKKTWSIKIAAPVTPPNTVHIPLYVAKDKNFFADEGLNVEIMSLEGGVGTARALVSGAVQVAGTSADPIIAAAAQGGGVKAVYTYAPRVSNSMVAAPDIKTPQQLKGRKIGIQEKNGFADVVSRLVLAKAGVKESEVQFISTSTAGRLPALLEGQTDTAILHVDQVIRAQATKPDLSVVAKVWETDPNWWYSAYAVSEDTIKKDPEMVEAFVRAIIKTTRWMYKNKDEVVAIAAKHNTGFSKEVFAQAYDILAAGRQWPVNEGISPEIVDYTVKKQMEIGVLKVDKAPTFEQLVDLSFARKVVQQLGREGDGL